MDGSVVALHEHFCDSCGASEVSVNLKWRMGIEHVGVGSSVGAFYCHVRIHQFELVADESHGMVPVEQARPQADFPSH